MRCLRLVYELESEGLLECFKDEYASKLAKVRLTDRGWNAVKELRSGSKTLQEAAEDALEAEERA
jgi:hypothetical protein